MAQYWPQYSYYKVSSLNHNNVYKKLAHMRKSLSELQLRAELDTQSKAFDLDLQEQGTQTEKNQPEDNTDNVESLKNIIQEQAQRISSLEEQNRAYHTIVNTSAHTNGHAHRFLENGSEKSGSSSKEEDETDDQSVYNSDVYRSLERRLKETEDRVLSTQEQFDHLNLLYTQKLIELNKLQLILSNQSKEMIQLEKAYFKLRCHLMKNRRYATESSCTSPAFSGSRTSSVKTLDSPL